MQNSSSGSLAVICLTALAAANVVQPTDQVCKPPKFNYHAKHPADCVDCFCFGKSAVCRSSELYRAQEGVSNGLTLVDNRHEPVSSPLHHYDRGNATCQLTGSGNLPKKPLYWSISRTYLGNLLESYGATLSYQVYFSRSTNFSQPTLDSNVLLVTYSNEVLRSIDNIAVQHLKESTVVVPFLPTSYFSRESQDSAFIQTDRRKLMNALLNVSRLLIKATYDASQTNSCISNVQLGIAHRSPTTHGTANLVEICKCPPSYAGTSCEQCMPGFEWSLGGPSLGKCVRSLDFDCDSENQPACLSRMRRQSANLPNDQSNCSCNAAGTLNVGTGCACVCKKAVEGNLCDQCKPGYFNLSAGNPEGCLSCYCSGVSTNCSSSGLYRYQKFLRIQDVTYTTADNRPTVIQPFIHDEIVILSDRTGIDSTFLSLPENFLGYLGDSYGGSLQYRLDAFGHGEPEKNIFIYMWSSTNSVYTYQLLGGFQSGIKTTIVVSLVEGMWRTNSGQSISRDRFMRVLRYVKALLIPMKYDTAQKQVGIDRVSISGVRSIFSELGLARAVERCQCPAPYGGLSCQNCSEELTRTEGGSCQADVPDDYEPLANTSSHYDVLTVAGVILLILWTIADNFG